ncbi:MAG TPA: RodZ domain-containing protein [Nitrospiraceae bacterium]|nr:RodZ domain-containing protein [Nitrospiraceae bacterium]
MTMESIGDFFRQVRETKGLTLDDVASKTRIHPDFLVALEEGNFTKLPDQVFAKGFVRSYARSLGLDEDDAMRRFEGSAGTFYDKQAEREQLRLQQVEDERRRKTNRKVVAAGTGVALLGLILLVTREQPTVTSHRAPLDSGQTIPKPVRAPAPNEKRDGPAVGRMQEPDDGGPSSPASRSFTSPSPSAMASPSESEDAIPPVSLPTEPVGGLPIDPGIPTDAPLVLDLEALDLTWVVVQVDNASPREALLRPGERVRWKGSERFMLTLGNAGGVRVELNGKVQGPFGPAGRVARDIVLKRS